MSTFWTIADQQAAAVSWRTRLKAKRKLNGKSKVQSDLKCFSKVILQGVCVRFQIWWQQSHCVARLKAKKLQNTLTFPIPLLVWAKDFTSEWQCNSNPVCDFSSAVIKTAHVANDDSSNDPIKTWQAWGYKLSHDAFWRGPTVPLTLNAIQTVGLDNLAGFNITTEDLWQGMWHHKDIIHELTHDCYCFSG